MSSAGDALADLVWATRGRSWGFRFLLSGGLSDPLPEYDRHFAHLGVETTAWRRAAGTVALRFPDPQGRRDGSGRIIPHEFLVSGDLADGIESVDDGIERVWQLVADAYDRVWNSASPPAPEDLRFDA